MLHQKPVKFPHALKIQNVISSSGRSFVDGVYLIELGRGHSPRGTKAEIGGARRAGWVSEGRRSLTDGSVS